MFLSVPFRQKKKKKNGINRHSALQPEFLACCTEREKKEKLKCIYSLDDEEYRLKENIVFLHDNKLVSLFSFALMYINTKWYLKVNPLFFKACS